MNSTVLKAIAIILFGIAAFDIMGVIVRLLGNNYPILQISVLRNLFGIIPSILILMMGPGLSDLKKINTVYYWKIIIFRGAVVLLAQFCFYTALTTIIAFASLSVSEIKPVIDFGKMMMAGIFFAFIFSPIKPDAPE